MPFLIGGFLLAHARLHGCDFEMTSSIRDWSHGCRPCVCSYDLSHATDSVWTMKRFVNDAMHVNL